MIGLPPNLVRIFRRRLGANDWSRSDIFARLDMHSRRAEQMVGVYYLFIVYYAYSMIGRMHNLAYHDPQLDHLWPIAWAARLPLIMVVDGLGVIIMGLALLAYLNPGKPVFRVCLPIAYLPYIAIPSSQGSIHHGDHAVFWIGVVFAFLPVVRDRASRLAYCLTFAAAQGLILTFYTMAGFHKVNKGLQALLAGEISNFSPLGFATTLAERAEQTGTRPLLADFLIGNAWLAWPLFLFLIYVQFVAIAFAARPSLHAVLGLFLLAFHLGTFLLLEITFPLHIFFVMLLFVSSPFLPQRRFDLDALGRLPGLAWMARVHRAPTALKPVVVAA